MIRLRDEGRCGERRGRRRVGQTRGNAALRDSRHIAVVQLVPPLPRGRGGGAEAQAEGQTEGSRKQMTREEEPGREARRPGAQVAYL